VVRVTLTLQLAVWFLRLFSPISWLGAVCTIEKNGRTFSHPRTAELYALLSFIPTFLLLYYADRIETPSVAAGVWGIIVIVENIQYQLQTVFIRPVFQNRYEPYSPERTLLIFLLQYIHTLFAYALVYLAWFSECFGVEFNVEQAVEFSVITITTVGYGNIHASPGTTAALFAATEALVGVFLLGLAISLAVNRTSSLSALKKASKQSLPERCKQALARVGYLDEVLQLSHMLNSDVWIVGGWVRSSALNIQYVGDIDLVTTLPIHDLEEALEKTSLVWKQTRKGALRAHLSDGNHVDISSSISHYGDSDIRKALREFNFTVNACAVNINEMRFLCIPQYELHIQKRTFDFLDPIRFQQKTADIALLKDFEILNKYYNLQALERTLWLSKEVLECEFDIQSKSSEQLLLEAGKYVSPYIPEGCDAWIVRGYVRCSVLGDLRYWDDIDLVVDCNESELYKHLNTIGANFTSNYYSSPKVFMSNGRTLDIWSLPKEQTIKEHVSTI